VPPRHLAIVVSDLHMGRNNPLDDFDADAPFLRFCRTLARHKHRHRYNVVDFVLNGDVLELWETVPDDELGEGDEARIGSNLEFPANSAAKERFAIDRGIWQIDAIMGAHTAVARGLAALLDAGINVVYLVGNHDHAMFCPELQHHFMTWAQHFGSGNPAGIMHFGSWYQSLPLRLYVEHGNQFSDGDSVYADFEDWRYDAPGYYFLRYVWNRMQASAGGSHTGGLAHALNVIVAIVKRVGGVPLDHERAIKFVGEYFEAHDALGFPLVPRPRAIGHLYDKWREAKAANQHLSPGDLINVAVQAAGDLFRADPRYTVKCDRIDVGAAVGGPTTREDDGLPGSEAPLFEWNPDFDDYWCGVGSRFDQAVAPFPRLLRPDYATLVAGHTHRARHVAARLRAALPETRYFNSGSWTRGHPRTYVYVSNRGDPLVYRGIKAF